MLPADLTGTMVFNQASGDFTARKGPVFANIILADEINRAPAKVQSALLEAMEERQVTIGDRSWPLPDPFFVMATQNPIEHEGTYPLPEAQLDRFLIKIKVDYPTQEEELQILRRCGDDKPAQVNKVLNTDDLAVIRNIVSRIKVDERIEEYIVAINTVSRIKRSHAHPHSRYIEFGASPRASLSLLKCARIKAFFEGRAYVVPEDVKNAAYDVLRHRLILSYEAEAEEITADEVIKQLLSSVSVP
jgi:MoxR-like ATPase